jgi:DNA-binding beta-propeller fold protein YncE
VRGKTIIVTSLLAIVFGILFFFTIGNSFATTENGENSGFDTYTNSDFKIQIQHPKNWDEVEEDLPQYSIVEFTAPDTKDTVQPAGLLVAEIKLSNGTSLDEFVDFFFKDRYKSPTDYKLISTSDATLGGMSAKQFVLYDYDKSLIPGLSGTTLKVMRVLALDNDTGTGYTMKYWSEPGLFNKYLKTAQKIIDSFELMDTGVESGPFVPEIQTTSSDPLQKENLEFTDLNNKFVSKWGTLGSGEGQFNQPVDLAVNSDNGLIYVADLQNNRIQIFDSDHNFVSQWGSYGSEYGQFVHPGGVAVSPWGEVFVTDIDNGRIQKFDLNGTFISKWGEPGTEQGQFNGPGDITFDPSGKFIFISDTDNNRIQKFGANGTFVTEWGSLGTRDGQFNHPTGISFDTVDQFLYVADTNNDRIQKFDSNGKFISKTGTSGNSDGEFKRPTSIAVDSANRILYVADTNNHRIQKFDLTGKFIAAWGSQGISNGQFNRPTGLGFESPNTVYVVDNQNNNIQVFSAPIETGSSSQPNQEFSASNQEISSDEGREEENSEIESVTQQGGPIDISRLPERITVSEGGYDNELVLVSAVSETEVLPVDNELSVRDYSFEVSDWNPKIIFQFLEGSESSLINIKQVVIGQIKHYSAPEDILEDATLWQNVPLNQEVVLKLPDNGINFMIVQAQFSDGVTGIYSGMFDLKTFLDKASDADLLRDDLKENRNWKVMKSTDPDLEKDIEFWQVAQEITCNNLKEFGFESCK